MSNPSTLYPNVVTYKCDGSYTGHMQPGGRRTDIPATYRQFQSLDRQLGSSVTWELQNKANILLRAQQIWNDSVTLLVMYKHQNTIKIKPMLLGAAPLGHQQLYLMGNAVMIPQWLAEVTQWHLGPKPPFPMDTISWKGFLPQASNLLWCHKHTSEEQQCERERCAEQSALLVPLDRAGVINVSLTYQREKHSGYFSLYTVSDHTCFIIKQRLKRTCLRYWNTSPWGSRVLAYVIAVTLLDCLTSCRP